MKIRFLPANQAWALCMGDTIVSIDGQSIWTCKRDLVRALRVRGVTL